MTQKTNSTSISNLPPELLIKIFSSAEESDYISLKGTNSNFRSVINMIGITSLNNLGEKFSSIHVQINELKSLPYPIPFFRISSDLKKDILSMPDGEEFLTELQNKNLSIIERAKQKLNWRRDKNLVILFENLVTRQLTALVRNTTNINLSAKAKNARDWISNEENREALNRFIISNNPSQPLLNVHPLLEVFLNLDDKFTLTEFPPEIGKFTSLTHLILSKNQFNSLPPEIGQLTALKQLCLQENKISSLPSQIGQLMTLQMLNLEENQLTSLPPEIGQLTNLRILSFVGNRLASLPKEIGQLTALLGLNLLINRLASLPPEIGQLTTLRILGLNKNQFNSLPKEIRQLSNLHIFGLSGNQLTSLPKEIGQLTNLQILPLEGNQLNSLPPEIGQLTNLQILSLGKLSSFSPPPEFEQFLMSASASQKEFIFGLKGENQFTSLPPQIGQLTALQVLFLEGNQFTFLPKEIGKLTDLKNLYLSKNQLTSLPPQIGQLTALQQLVVANNLLTSLPPEIGQLTALQILNLNHNKLPSRPPEIGQLTNLQDLDLSGNPFCSFSLTAPELINLLTRLRESQLTLLNRESRLKLRLTLLLAHFHLFCNWQQLVNRHKMVSIITSIVFPLILASVLYSFFSQTNTK